MRLGRRAFGLLSITDLTASCGIYQVTESWEHLLATAGPTGPRGADRTGPGPLYRELGIQLTLNSPYFLVPGHHVPMSFDLFSHTLCLRSHTHSRVAVLTTQSHVLVVRGTQTSV